MKRNKVNRYLDVLNAATISDSYKIRFLQENFTLSDLRVYWIFNSDWSGEIVDIEGVYLRVNWVHCSGVSPENTSCFLPCELRFTYERRR